MNGDPPVGTALCDSGGHGVMTAALDGIPGRSTLAQQTVDQNPRAAPLIAVDHQAMGIRADGIDRVAGSTIFETRIATTVNHALLSTVAFHQFELVGHERSVVLSRGFIQQMNSRQITLAAACGFQTRGAADGDKLGLVAALLHLAQEEI